ncbi:MAG: glutaredoxin family protein [Microbacteriaceae bacterium]
MADVTVELFGKPGCHLCDDARIVIERVLAEFPVATLVTRNILDDAEWFETMKNDIPVVAINSVRHVNWIVDEKAFRAAMTEVAS